MYKYIKSFPIASSFQLDDSLFPRITRQRRRRKKWKEEEEYTSGWLDADQLFVHDEIIVIELSKRIRPVILRGLNPIRGGERGKRSRSSSRPRDPRRIVSPGELPGIISNWKDVEIGAPGCKWSGLAEYASVTGTLTNTTDYTGGYLHGISYSRDRFNAAASFRPWISIVR